MAHGIHNPQKVPSHHGVTSSYALLGERAHSTFGFWTLGEPHLAAEDQAPAVGRGTQTWSLKSSLPFRAGLVFLFVVFFSPHFLIASSFFASLCPKSFPHSNFFVLMTIL